MREGKGGWVKEVVEDDRLELLVLGGMADPLGSGRGKGVEST